MANVIESNTFSYFYELLFHLGSILLKEKYATYIDNNDSFQDR